MGSSEMKAKPVGVQLTLELPVEGQEYSTAYFLYRFEVDTNMASADGEFSLHKNEGENEDRYVNWAKGRVVKESNFFDVSLNMKMAQLMEPRSPFDMIWEAVKEHRAQHPDHGVGCTCMDKHIRTVRAWLDVDSERGKVNRGIQESENLRNFRRIVDIANHQW